MRAKLLLARCRFESVAQGVQSRNMTRGRIVHVQFTTIFICAKYARTRTRTRTMDEEA